MGQFEDPNVISIEGVVVKGKFTYFCFNFSISIATVVRIIKRKYSHRSLILTPFVKNVNTFEVATESLSYRGDNCIVCYFQKPGSFVQSKVSSNYRG